MPTAEIEEELSNYVHDLFLNREYTNWRKDIKSASEGKWHSLVSSLAMHSAPIDQALSFGEEISSKLVFNYTKAPDYKASQMLMVQFTISGSMWYSIVWHCPERN